MLVIFNLKKIPLLYFLLHITLDMTLIINTRATESKKDVVTFLEGPRAILNILSSKVFPRALSIFLNIPIKTTFDINL